MDSSNSTDSAISLRIHSAKTAIKTPKRKGIRQPNSKTLPSESAEWIIRPVKEPSVRPSIAPVIAKLPTKTCLLTGLDSTEKIMLPTISPPTDKPWNIRITTSMRVAHNPASAYVGKHPIMKVDAPIIVTDIVRAVLRPYVSPMCPNMTPPKGLMKKAPPNTANALSRAVAELEGGKKFAPIWGAK
eukprot:CAMPEP_0169454522 /NCGR_PEP_ID=MMETSP1042-20121227/15322_1 /TAXON_ID=464988 /ORGANISM="Hemiselmis andersenii, Strain CCMP1180" /LENGTH=185 /DNA_ID=CAMNT_0009566599 /DNA_START=758 /DNA_END=1315 /DNA_ORIENTATION=-